MTARAELFALPKSNYTRPMGVLQAEASADVVRLSPAEGDARLIQQLRADATSREIYVAELEAKLVESDPPTTEALMFADPQMRFAEVGNVVKALCKAGHRVRFESAFDEFGAFMLTVRVVEKAA